MDQIREADNHLFNDVSLIINECAHWLSQKGMTHWLSYYTPEVIAEKIAHGNMFIVYEKGEPAATVSLSIDSPSYYDDTNIAHFEEPTEKGLYISALGVRPEFQGKGLATKLVAKAEDMARQNNIKYVRFDARKDYTKLIEFYQKVGYQIKGEFLDDGEMYCLFEKRI
jgi:ribosomal protein S18 acetylase RimI-like enzyme